MRRVWLGIIVGLIAGTSGCGTLRRAEHPAMRGSESGFANVIHSVPEPGLTWRVTNPSPQTRFGLRGGKSSPASPPNIPPFAERDPVEWATTVPSGMEHGFDKLPKADLAKRIPAVALKPGDGPYRVLTEPEVRSLAMQYAPAARRIEMENLIPVSHVESKRLWHQQDETGSPALDHFFRQARELSARGDRVKVVGEAAGKFYDLAEAEGRAEILRLGIADFDAMLAEMKKVPPRLPGGGAARMPPLPDDASINSQRGQLLESADLLSMNARTLNIDLKRMTGLKGNTADRLYPTGEFGIDPTPPDVPTLVRTAIENRPDLQLLRLAYYELSEESLPAIRDQLRQRIGFLAPVPKVLGRHRQLLATALQRFGKKPCLDPVLVHELAVRRAQLFDIICEEERKVADDVRKAAVYQETAASLVASTRTRSEDLRKKVDDAKSAKIRVLAAEFPLLLEWYKARAEVIQAVMGWHKARVLLLAAQGNVL